ncbi:MAG: hypothetical protein ACW967_07230 [Candidatus Hodarchaeales archaeon]|jgi:uncharacterized protein YdcH (DUF465 family)
MLSNYFKSFYGSIIPENLINDLSTFLPEPEDDITDSSIKKIVDFYRSHNLETDDILVKFWIMSGLPVNSLITLLEKENLRQNSWDWIIWDTKIRGDTETSKMIPGGLYEKDRIVENHLSGDFVIWEHWLLKLDPRTFPTEEVRNESYDKLLELEKKSDSRYASLFKLYTELHKEFSEIPNENHIVNIDKILGNFDWIGLGSHWQSASLYEFARIQTDFSDITGANETIQEIKNVSWNNPYFLGLVLRLEAKINYILNQQEEMDHLFQSSQFFFQKIENNKDFIYNILLQSGFWSSKSKEKSLDLLKSLKLEKLEKMDENWLMGMYYSNLANLQSAFENHSESSQYFKLSASYFKKTIDKLNFWRNLIDHGFNLYVLEKFEMVSTVIDQLKVFNLPTMFEFRVAYLNAITHFRQSDIKAAIQTLETSIQEAQKVMINPQLPWFYSLLAEIYRIQGKWFLCLDYLILAMKSYFHLNESNNALKVKMTTSYLQLLLEKSELALKTAKDILTVELIDEDMKTEVFWFLIKYFYLFRNNELENISDIINKFEIEIKDIFSNVFYLIFKEFLQFIQELNGQNTDFSLIYEIHNKFNELTIMEQIESEWLIELKILMLYYLLLDTSSDNRKQVKSQDFLSISNSLTYPSTITDEMLKLFLNKTDLSQLNQNDLSEYRKYLMTLSIERCIYRIVSPIFPLKLY